ncbi:MAG: DNA-binding NtrC family response regulator [Verrucomicrobiales bacterium]|jgi:DNA-binding NtrC family response regulator
MPPKPQSQTILVVDPDRDFLTWVDKHLRTPETDVVCLTDSKKALEHYIEHTPDLVIAELRLNPIGGMDLLKQLRLNDPNSMVLLYSGFPPTSAVIEAMRLGAFEFLRRETLTFDLRPIVEKALSAQAQIRSTPEAAPSDPASDPSREKIIGSSIAMQEVFKMIGRVSHSDAPVLVTGESGTGKEVVANAIHSYSPRTDRDYVAINCAAIPEALLESELFGHEKGSFTGAAAQRIGRFEQCDGGTLFLDEIGEMPIAVQSKILRVLQEGEFSRVGGNKTISSDVRILAATNRNLEREVEKGTFREDLFYRLNVVRVHIPPLRERTDDIRTLAEFFLKKIAIKQGGAPLRLSEDSMRLLENYNWPGNVRELENTMQRAAVLATSDVLLPKDIPLGETKNVSPAYIYVEHASRDPKKADAELVAAALKRSNNDTAAAAKLLNTTEAALKKRGT